MAEEKTENNISAEETPIASPSSKSTAGMVPKELLPLLDEESESVLAGLTEAQTTIFLEIVKAKQDSELELYRDDSSKDMAKIYTGGIFTIIVLIILSMEGGLIRELIILLATFAGGYGIGSRYTNHQPPLK